MTWYEVLEDARARNEADLIVRAFAELPEPIAIGGVAEHGGIGFLYAEEQLLAREDYLPRIQERFAERFEYEIDRRVIRDIVLLKVRLLAGSGEEPAESNQSAPDGGGEDAEGGDAQSGDSAGDRAEGTDGPPEDGGENREGPDGPPEDRGERPEPELPALVRLVADIEEIFGPGILALNHVMTVAQGHPYPCPATEPEEVYDPRPYPPVCPTGGARVRIWVADTGVVDSTLTSCRWLDTGVSGDPDPRVTGNTIEPYGGHGTFVAGVMRCLAPEAEIKVKDVFNVAGSRLESDFVRELRKGFEWGAEIFHLTVASPTMHNRPLLAFGTWLEDLRQHKGVVCVVAAGNNDSRHPYWPAAFRGVISVGALSADWRSRAYFSNYGGWVDVYAPGQNLVNAFPTGTYTCQVYPHAGEERTFSGLAQWSGTSFSTPIVTGLIAARMARYGESGQEAAEALLAEARAQTIPGVGPVLFPRCDDDDECCGRCGDRHCRCGGDHGWRCGGDHGWRCGGDHGWGCGEGGGGGRGCRGDCGCGGGRHGHRRGGPR